MDEVFYEYKYFFISNRDEKLCSLEKRKFQRVIEILPKGKEVPPKKSFAFLKINEKPTNFFTKLKLQPNIF